jgi:predicted AlkP superfamily pyrophosphatase or phosphodiesterase
VTRCAILFVVDGLRPDALQQAPTSEIDRLVTQGDYTWQAPSISLPCHLSLFWAVPPSCHNVYQNLWMPPLSTVPSLVEVVHQAGLGTAAFYTWETLRDLARPGFLDVAYYRRLGDPEGDSDLEIAAAAAHYIVEQRPSFTFVYLGATDEVGHRHGWMSAPYLRAVSKADRAIGLILQPLRASDSLGDTVCMVLSDHGGPGTDHSAGLPEDLTIPWVVNGPGIRCGHRIKSAVSIIDPAPTLAHLLGLPRPAEWHGQVMTEALI